jgi:DNA polymerase III alpha subunit
MILSARSYFSFKHGIHSPEELLRFAASRGIRQLGLADLDSAAGIYAFLQHAPRYGIKPLIGVSFTEGGQVKYVQYARNTKGLGAILSLLSARQLNGQPLPATAPESPDVWTVYPFDRFSFNFPLSQNAFIGISLAQLSRFRLVQHHFRPHQVVLWHGLTLFSERELLLHRCLKAMHSIDLVQRVQADALALESLAGCSEAYLCHRLREFPDIIWNTRELFEKSHVDLEFGKPKNRLHFTGSAAEDYRMLYQAAYDGLCQRFPDGSEAQAERLEKELGMIRELGYTAYFLINYDLIQFCRRKGFFHVGRGSGANSLVAYCLGITDVDPLELDLYFERFINPHRSSPPDFDLDFSWRDREQVQRYLFSRYPEGHVALLGAFSTFQQKSAIRELGSVMGLGDEEIVRIQERPGTEKLHSALLNMAAALQDVPSHITVHAGGVLISEASLTHHVSLFRPPGGLPTAACSMYESEDLGLYKFDILSQRGLGHIRDALTLVSTDEDILPVLRDTKQLKSDPAIKELIRSGDTLGCFYVESPAMRMLLRKLRADNYLELVAASSIIRPGVARSGMMRAYVMRFRGLEQVRYAHPVLEKLLAETYGVMVYQEDVIKVAHHFAGLSLAEADVLRRGMAGKFRSKEEMQRVQEAFFAGCSTRGYSEELSKEVWRQIESFAGYSFSKAHSASYAVESLQSLYLRAHYPLMFITAVINNFGGFYRTEIYVREAMRLGAQVELPCMNHSRWESVLIGKTLYLGFSLVKGMQKEAVDRMLAVRDREGIFTDWEDAARRSGYKPDSLYTLARIEAFRFTGRSVPELLWRLSALKNVSPVLSGGLFSEHLREAELPTLTVSPQAGYIAQLELLGFCLESPFNLTHADSGRPGDYDIHAALFPLFVNKEIVCLGYLITLKPVKTRDGKRMFFGTFMDVHGESIDTVHFPGSFSAHSPVSGIAVYRIRGRVVDDLGAFLLEVKSIEKLSLSF